MAALDKAVHEFRVFRPKKTRNAGNTVGGAVKVSSFFRFSVNISLTRSLSMIVFCLVCTRKASRLFYFVNVFILPCFIDFTVLIRLKQRVLPGTDI